MNEDNYKICLYLPTEMCLDVPKMKYVRIGKKAEQRPYPTGTAASRAYAIPEITFKMIKFTNKSYSIFILPKEKTFN